jgi:spore germination protein
VKFLKNIFLFILLVSCNASGFASENIFYALRFKTDDRMSPPKDTLSSLQNHYTKINILIPQAYHIDESGHVAGEIESEILDFAIKHSMKIMPLVTNHQFDKEKAHRFLFDAKAQATAMGSLIKICRENHFYGIQLDFEMVSIEDRGALTRFYKYAANEMHKNGFLISFSIAPVVTDKPASFFLKKIYNNWEGAYDLKELGDIADFVSIMAYNQHGGVTTAGPTASWAWTNHVVQYALKYISPNKISLGVPDYSTHWYTGTTTNDLSGKVVVRMRGIGYKDVIKLTKQQKARLQWDKDSKTFYSIFSRYWLNEYLFVEDVKSFRCKYDLVSKYKLRGISVFDLGTEDNRIWEFL